MYNMMQGWRRIEKHGTTAQARQTAMSKLSTQEDISLVGRYLENFYEREIKLQVSEEECDELRNGVETLVWRILDEIASKEPKFFVEPNNLLKVGSFYEGTKIRYPDEFDFLVVLQTITPIPDHDLTEQERSLKTIQESLKLYSWYIQRAARCLEMKNTIGVELKTGYLSIDPESILNHGPATKLHANYVSHDIGKPKHIEIDITAAVRVKGLPESFEGSAPGDKLLQMACDMKSHLILFNYNIELPTIETFTDTEQDYIVGIMSNRHKRAFMILKYLVNGKHTTEAEKYHIFSSYAIKTIMFQHEHQCTGNLDLSLCVLDVLERMHKSLKTAISNVSHHSLKRPIGVWHNVFTGRSFSKILGTEVKKRKAVLRRLIDSLDNYGYGSSDIKPLIDYF